MRDMIRIVLSWRGVYGGGSGFVCYVMVESDLVRNNFNIWGGFRDCEGVRVFFYIRWFVLENGII